MGGTAEVWRAHDERADRPVALKRLHAFLVPDEGARERFASEARAVAGLTHPGIVGVHEVHAEDEGSAIALELVDGESLDDRLARTGALSPEVAAGIAGDVADALAYAHDQGIVHRDVKPANILVGADGRARLVDFGIARALDEPGAAPTVTGTVMGTLRYMAPETLRGERAGPAADVFGLGAVLYEMLSGRPAYPVTNPAALIEAHRSGPTPLDEAPPVLGALAIEALREDASARPAAGDLAARLRSEGLVDEDTQPIAIPVPVAAPSSSTVPSAVAPPAAVAPTRRPSRRALMAGAVGLAFVVAAAAFGGAGRPTGQPSPGSEGAPVGPSAAPSVAPAADQAESGDTGGGGKGKGHGKGKGKGGG